jgi:predicted secreted hydrolase
MLYTLRAPTGETTAVFGSHVLADGTVVDLPPGSVSIEPTGTWTSPHTGATYPSGWLVDVPREGARFRVQPRLPDQELYFPGVEARTPIYWEGAVTVLAADTDARLGLGYVELTGYATGPGTAEAP